MLLDIITIALIVVPTGLGMARGFLYIAVRLLGWLGALAAGVFAAPVLRDFLAGTTAGEIVHDALLDQLSPGAEGVNAAASGLPAILGSIVDQTVENALEGAVSALEALILSVASFLIIVIGIRLLLILVIRPLTRRRGKDPVSLLNKLAGMLVGGVEGLLLAFLFLAALIPVMHMGSPETAASISQALRFSYIAGPLYDGNLLLAVLGQLLGT